MLYYYTIICLCCWFAVAEIRSLEANTGSLGNAAADTPFPKRPGHRIPVPSLYHRKYSEQTFIGTHNSIAIRTAGNNWSLSGNQYWDLSIQLESGVRLLQAQGHMDPNGTSEIRLCHFHCALMDGGSLKDFLNVVLDWLRANPYEVVTLLFVNTGPPLKDWAAAYYDTGADLVSYSPPVHKRYGKMRIKDWPTIAEMIESNVRLVTFLSHGANLEATFLLPEHGFLFETNFEIEEPDQYTCHPSHPSQPPGSYIPDRLSLVNHFLYARFFGISKSSHLTALANNCVVLSSSS